MISVSFICVIFLGTLQCVLSRAPAQIWSDCGNPASPVRLTHLSIDPYPIYLPGNIGFSISGYTNETLGSAAFHLSLERVGSWFNVPIPCIGNIGSCTYDDMCTMLDDMINDNWLGITQTLGQDIRTMLTNNGLNPGLCPQPPQTINIVRAPLRLPTMPAALFWFAEGRYKANIRVTDNASGNELVCLNVIVELRQNQEECSGFWGCLFRR